METPATQGAAVVAFVQVAFEAFIDMKYSAEPRLEEHLAGFEGTFSTPTDQHYGGASLLRGADRPTQHQFAHIGNEMGVHRPFGLVDPGDVNRPLGMTDEEIFHSRPDVDQNGPWVILYQLPRLLRVECAKVGMRSSGRGFFRHGSLSSRVESNSLEFHG